MHILFFVFVIIMAVLYTGVLYFCAVTLYDAFKYKFKFLKKVYFIVLFIGSFLIYLITTRIFNYMIINPVFNRFFFYYGFTSFPFIFILFGLLLVWKISYTFFIKHRINNESRALKINFTVVGCIMLFSLLIITVGMIIARFPAVTKYNAEIPRKSSDISKFRITMVSDIHINDYIDTQKLNKMAERINEQKGDIVIIDGDLTNGRVTNLNEDAIVQYLSSIAAPYGKFAVLGNHDYYGNEEDKLDALYEKAGVKVLRDEAFTVDNKFCLIGREDQYILTKTGRNTRKSIEDIVNTHNINLPLILLDHRPVDFAEAEKDEINLDLSGHTHNGQIFPGNIITRFFYINKYGMYKNDDFISIVSSGYSTWGPPVRFGSKSEVVVIDVNLK